MPYPKFAYLSPQLLQIIPPNVRRQQVVLVHPQEKQLRPTIDAGISIEMVAVLDAWMGQLRVERTRKRVGGLGVGEDETNPLSEPLRDVGL